MVVVSSVDPWVLNGGGLGPSGTTIAETSVLSPLMPFFAMLMGINHMQSYSCYEEVGHAGRVDLVVRG